MSTGFGPQELLDCYRRGVFPMADARDDPNLFLIDPDLRGVLPLNGFHVPKRLARTVRQMPFDIRVDTAFSRVIEKCAEPHPDRPSTWINPAILNLYSQLHRLGYAHSVEAWEGDDLVGGLYGVAIGGAFFGESMFSRKRDASKITLVHLVGLLIEGGYQLLDAQFHNAHLDQFGIMELARSEFHRQLKLALPVKTRFAGEDQPGVARHAGAGQLSSETAGAPFSPKSLTGSGTLHLITQTS